MTIIGNQHAEDLRLTCDALETRAKSAEARLAGAIATLQSIASNSCCSGCNEAALVARAFLRSTDSAPAVPEVCKGKSFDEFRNECRAYAAASADAAREA